MAFKKRKAKWAWRDFLTDEEIKELHIADHAKKQWQRLNKARASIQNRAIQRAKYAARKAG